MDLRFENRWGREGDGREIIVSRTRRRLSPFSVVHDVDVEKEEGGNSDARRHGGMRFQYSCLWVLNSSYR